MNRRRKADDLNFRNILGIRFFVGKAEGAIEMVRDGGLVVVPSAPVLKNLVVDDASREALLEADVAITDSSLMVMLWNLIERDNIARLSGLEYLTELLNRPECRESGRTFWIMARPSSARLNLDWLRSRGIEVPPENVYIAPQYGAHVHDQALLDQIDSSRPAHVIITLGGGTQERLGLYLKRNLHHLPAIHCIGAAIAFLSGDQVYIPVWADRLYMGWLFRCLSSPSRYLPRYWASRKLVGLIWTYRAQLPLAHVEQSSAT